MPEEAGGQITTNAHIDADRFESDLHKVGGALPTIGPVGGALLGHRTLGRGGTRGEIEARGTRRSFARFVALVLFG
jgi:hypothetical protein